MFNDILNNYRQIERERNSKLLVFVTGERPNLETQISSEMHDYFVNYLDKFHLPDKISLYLYTRGGDTMAAWSLINLNELPRRNQWGYQIGLVLMRRKRLGIIPIVIKNNALITYSLGEV